MQSPGSLAVVADRYELDRELTRGAASATWRARDTLLGRTVTLEIVRPALADDPAFGERLAFEARRIAPLVVPGLSRLLDTGREDGVPFLVREDVPGPSAREVVQADGPLELDRALAITRSVLETLQAVHDAGVRHLGVGADAVFVGRDGSVRLSGLGVAAAARPDGSGDDGDDVVGAAGLLFEMLTGEPPGDRRAVRELRPEVPRRIDRTIARALDREPSLASASAFAAALADPTPPDTPHRGILRTWLAVPIAVALVAVAVIGAGLWLGRLEVGGPLGIRSARTSPSAHAGSGIPPSTSIRPVDAFAFDPYGDDTENSSLASLAIDGDTATAWRSEDYFDAQLHKPGMGLVFDLGERRHVVGFRLWTPHPGFVFHVAVGDDPNALVSDVGRPITANAETHGSLDASGRYVLVWITTVVDTGDGHRAEIAEFRPLVSTDD